MCDVKVVEKGRKLLELVACSSLENEFSDLVQTWTALCSQVDGELKRFDSELCISCFLLITINYFDPVFIMYLFFGTALLAKISVCVSCRI